MDLFHFMIMGSISILVSFFDLKERRAPDLLTLGGLVTVLAMSCTGGWGGVLPTVGGAVLGAGVLFLARVATNKGLGWGDIKYAAFLGAILQPRLLLACLFMSAIFTLLFCGIAYIAGKFKRQTKIAFAPFLAVGAFAAACLAAQISAIDI